jgi:hypothetical protein
VLDVAERRATHRQQHHIEYLEPMEAVSVKKREPICACLWFRPHRALPSRRCRSIDGVSSEKHGHTWKPFQNGLRYSWVIGTVDGALLVLYCPIDDLEERREIDHWFADLRGCTRKACSAVCHGVDQGVDLIEYTEWWTGCAGIQDQIGYQQYFAYRIVHDVDTPYHGHC